MKTRFCGIFFLIWDAQPMRVPVTGNAVNLSSFVMKERLQGVPERVCLCCQPISRAKHIVVYLFLRT